jgi:hypothetical protein
VEFSDCGDSFTAFRNRTLRREAVLERDRPTLGLFETLESGRDNGSNRRRDEAQERRSSEREAKARREIPREGTAERGSADDSA